MMFGNGKKINGLENSTRIEIMKILIILLLPYYSFSQHTTKTKLEIGERIYFYSKILNEDRELYIYTPTSSNSSSKSYPVIYLLDAESLFFATAGALKFMNYSSSMPQMPEAYIVGIVNTNRNRDMPMPQEIEKTEGANNFYSFLATEIVPFINKKHLTTGLNILIGHSQGALFATYATLNNPNLFQFTVALDAPMGVVKSVEQSYTKKISETCNIKYVSVKSRYGWDPGFKPTGNCLTYTQLNIENESHETMPYKGFYEGLKVLFNDYIPPVRDLSLQEIITYYKSLEKKYHFLYPLPSKVLLESARQNIGQSKKRTAIELINENNRLYGVSEFSKQLSEKAIKIVKGPDERVTFSLAHPSPDEKAIQPFLGNWSGILYVPGGTNTTIDWVIKIVNGKYQMESDVFKQFKTISDFLYINENNELVWGRKHEGGGIYISTGKLSTDGMKITGTEELIGFDFPPEWPAFKANTFEYKKL